MDLHSSPPRRGITPFKLARYGSASVPIATLLLGLAPAAVVMAQQQPHLSSVAVAAATCANCHGTDGRSPGIIPSIAGQPKDRLLQRLQDFKAGIDPRATVMSRLMKGYSEDELRDLAGYFSEVPR